MLFRSRLEEMPGEEGYPAYLGSRLAQFYERAGRVTTTGSAPREGALSVIGAVSPPGGDISEPVSQATLRIVKVFWSLDSALAYSRHFPAINWLTSYSLYADNMGAWFDQQVAGGDWMDLRARIMRLLQEESELDEIVKLVGMDALSPSDRLKLEAARSIREDFLHQDAFHEIDTYTPLDKQYAMMQLILLYYAEASAALGQASIEELVKLPVRERIGRFKYTPDDQIAAEFDAISRQLSEEIATLTQKEED